MPFRSDSSPMALDASGSGRQSDVIADADQVQLRTHHAFSDYRGAEHFGGSTRRRSLPKFAGPGETETTIVAFLPRVTVD